MYRDDTGVQGPLEKTRRGPGINGDKSNHRPDTGLLVGRRRGTPGGSAISPRNAGFADRKGGVMGRGWHTHLQTLFKGDHGRYVGHATGPHSFLHGS